MVVSWWIVRIFLRYAGEQLDISLKIITPQIFFYPQMTLTATNIPQPKYHTD